MSRKPATLIAFIVIAASHFAAHVASAGGCSGGRPQPRFIPPSHGQYPVYVSPNEVTGINPITGGLDTQNRQIDNTAYQYGRNESQNNGTKRWVRRPIYNSRGQVVGYQRDSKPSSSHWRKPIPMRELDQPAEKEGAQDK